MIQINLFFFSELNDRKVVNFVYFIENEMNIVSFRCLELWNYKIDQLFCSVYILFDFKNREIDGKCLVYI